MVFCAEVCPPTICKSDLGTSRYSLINSITLSLARPFSGTARTHILHSRSDTFSTFCCLARALTFTWIFNAV